MIKGDDDHVFGPLHQRFVDFGGGRELTIVEYAYRPEGPESEKSIPSARAQVCPSGTDPAALLGLTALPGPERSARPVLVARPGPRGRGRGVTTCRCSRHGSSCPRLREHQGLMATAA